MAHAATGQDDFLGSGECRGGRQCSRLDVARTGGGEKADRDHAERGCAPDPPGRRAAGVPLVEEVTDDRAEREHDRDDHPIVAGREQQRIVIADHQHHDRQGQVVVVDRAFLAGLAELRVGRLAGEQRSDDLLLVRDDRQKHVGDHDGADDRADLVERAASAQHMREGVGEADQEQIAADREGKFVAGEARPAGGLIEQPCDEQAAETEQARLQRCQVEHRFVDQEQFCIEIIDDDHQREARQPGRVGFPFEPGQFVGQLRRRDQIFDDPVEAAAMHLPRLALDAIGQIRPGPEAEVEMDEIE
jgi:hypothetical protein